MIYLDLKEEEADRIWRLGLSKESEEKLIVAIEEHNKKIEYAKEILKKQQAPDKV
jgi:hypothetical protein